MKFFDRIQNKLLLATVIVVLFPLVGTALYGNWITSRILQEKALDNARRETSQQAAHISNFLATARDDILFLSDTTSLNALIAARAAGDQAKIDQSRAEVASDFMAFSRHRGIYYQIRYLTETGQEFVRVDSDGEMPFIVPDADLQDKSDRYYFREATTLALDEIFVSRLDLNREYGSIEVPYKPVLRYATPVFDDTGTFRGVVITNILANRFLDTLMDTDNSRSDVVLVDNDGYYLVHPDTSREWGGITDLNTGKRLQQDFSEEEVAAILQPAAGEIITRRALVFSPVFPNPADRSIYWVLIHAESPNILFASVWEFRFTAAAILLVAIMIAIFMALLLAQNLTAPIVKLRAGVERLARGKLHEPVQIHSTDELGELATSFNDMAETIERYRRQREYLLEEIIGLQEEERRVAAYDIHDGLIQRLIGARLQFTNFSQLKDTDPQSALAAFQRGIEHLKAAIVEGRHLIEGLRPPLLDDLGLVPALNELAQQTAADMHAEISFVNHLDDTRLPPPIEITAFRIAQEALNNCRKHSKSSKIMIDIACKNGCLQLTVQDWGKGFDTACITKIDHCVGLIGMEERAHMLGGTCQIESLPEQGTIVTIKLSIEPTLARE